VLKIEGSLLKRKKAQSHSVRLAAPRKRENGWLPLGRGFRVLRRILCPCRERGLIRMFKEKNPP